MLSFDIPGFRTLTLEHLVVDFNGVLAVDGKVLMGAHESLKELARQVQVHVVTADTFGTARNALSDLDAKVTVLPLEGQDVAKRDYVRSLGADRTVCIGNGRNDRLMLKEAALSFSVLQMEGLAMDAALASHVLVPSVQDAFDLLLAEKKLIATLRS